jgi:uncharacterized protein YwqG
MVQEVCGELSLPVLHSTLEQYRADLEAVAMPGWELNCRKVNAVSRFETHLGGVTPFVPISKGWPHCDKCGEKLHFVWQVDFADFGGAGSFAERGLFQFFYCWRCLAVPPDEYGYSCRWYPEFDAEQAGDVLQMDSPYEANIASYHLPIGPCVFDNVRFLSVPSIGSKKNPIPLGALNAPVGDEGKSLWEIYYATREFRFEGKMTSRIAGYPPWVQFRDETPACCVCSKRAEFVGAIGSDDTDLIWGDSGYWYFFACTATPECHGLHKPLMAHQCL